MDEVNSQILYCEHCGQVAGFQTATAQDVRLMEEQLRKEMDLALEMQRHARFALEMLSNDHVQRNLFRMGCLGSDDVKSAINALKLICPNG